MLTNRKLAQFGVLALAFAAAWGGIATAANQPPTGGKGNWKRFSPVI